MAVTRIATITLPAAIELSRFWSDDVNFRLLPHYKSCCLHLFDRIKCDDPYFCIWILSLTSFDFANNVVWIGASEHWQLVQRPIPVIVIIWSHLCVLVDIAIIGHFQARRPMILDNEINLLLNRIVRQLWQIGQRLVFLVVERRIRLYLSKGSH